MKNYLKNSAKIITILVAAFSVFSPMSALAAGDSSLPDSPLKPSVSELRISGKLVAGNTYSGNFLLVNEGQSSVDYNVELGEDGVAEDYSIMSSWLKFDTSSASIKASESQNISFRIKIPKDASSGGKYATVLVNSANYNPVSVKILVVVDGPIEPKGVNSSRDIQGFSFSPSLSTSATVKNFGNIDFELKSELKVHQLLSGEEIYSNEYVKTLLPDESDTVVQNWDSAPIVGVFNVSQTLTYINENGERVAATMSKIVIICPIWLIAVLVVLIIAAVLSFIFIPKLRKNKDDI